LMDCAPAAGEADASPVAPWRIVNIGRGAPLPLLEFVEIVERKLGKQAIRNYLDMQKGDAPQTYADCALLERLTGYRPATGVEEGVSAFVDWYRAYRAAAPGA